MQNINEQIFFVQNNIQLLYNKMFMEKIINFNKY